MSGRQWIIWSALGIVGAVICAVVYYRAGGETTWLFVIMTAFIAAWIPVQVWIGRSSGAAFDRVRERRQRSN